MDTTTRLLRLLSLLQTHRYWRGTELAGRLGVSGRTLRRDVDRLRELGYMVNARRGADGGYQLEAGKSLPPLLLDDEEAVAIAVGLRSATGGSLAGIEEISLQALAKFEQILPPRLRRRINALSTSIVPIAGYGPTVDASTLAMIAQACRDQERIRFSYRRRDGVEGERRVEPHRLVPAGRRWYLVGWDADRSDWRTFRVDRLSEVFNTGWRFEARALPAEDAAAFVKDAINATPARYHAVVVLHGSAEDVESRTWYIAEAPLESIDDTSCILRAKSDSLEWLTANLTLIGVDFEVLEPIELIEHIRALTARLAAATVS